MSEQIDYERCKTDFIYFATHCLIDARTGKPFPWTKAQLKILQKFSKDKGHPIILNKGRTTI